MQCFAISSYTCCAADFGLLSVVLVLLVWFFDVF